MKWTESESILCERFGCRATIRQVTFLPHKDTAKYVDCERECKDCSYGKTKSMCDKDDSEIWRKVFRPDY